MVRVLFVDEAYSHFSTYKNTTDNIPRGGEGGRRRFFHTNSSMVSSSTPLHLLFYDDRYNETRDRGTLPLYVSLDRHAVPFSVGPPIGAQGSSVSSGRPGDGPAEKSLLRYRPGVKIEWLTHELPLTRSEFVLILDTDVVWLCDAEEVLAKRKALLTERAARADTVILFGERGMWPPYQEYRGVQLRTNETAGYPPAKPRAPFRFVNAGAALGRPDDLLALYRCMQRRYAGFPNACPAGHGGDGALRYYAANRSWVPPPLTQPSRLTKFHGMRLKGSNWGWEQGCFHMYYLEHLNGDLPPSCPPVELDRTGRWVLHLAGVSRQSIEWTHRAASMSVRGEVTSPPASRTGQPRATLRETGQRPCALHANGPAKKALPSLWSWWADPRSARPMAWA